MFERPAGSATTIEILHDYYSRKLQTAPVIYVDNRPYRELLFVEYEFFLSDAIVNIEPPTETDRIEREELVYAARAAFAKTILVDPFSRRCTFRTGRESPPPCPAMFQAIVRPNAGTDLMLVAFYRSQHIDNFKYDAQTCLWLGHEIMVDARLSRRPYLSHLSQGRVQVFVTSLHRSEEGGV